MRRWLPLTLALIPSFGIAAPVQGPIVYRIAISGVVENGLAPYVARSLREAEAAGAVASYLDIDTPGVRIDDAEALANDVRDARIPVGAYVTPPTHSPSDLILTMCNGNY